MTLVPEDVLYLTMPATGLEQLWRVPPSEELTCDPILS